MRTAIALLLSLTFTLSAQAPRRPKLVVAITVDQFRYDYLTKFRDKYNGGLARLLNQGAVFTNAYYEHYPTVTAIGHSTFLTGATPSISGIIANEWFDRETGKAVTSVEDSEAITLGGQGRGGKAASPRRLLVSTVGDELKMAGRGSKVIGISVKDRSAILPAGHLANGAYWISSSLPSGSLSAVAGSSRRWRQPRIRTIGRPSRIRLTPTISFKSSRSPRSLANNSVSAIQQTCLR
jgi:hypothetical protein